MAWTISRGSAMAVAVAGLLALLPVVSCPAPDDWGTGMHQPTSVAAKGELGAPCSGLALSLRATIGPTDTVSVLGPFDLVVVNVSQKPISVLIDPLGSGEFMMQSMLFDSRGKGVSPTDFASAFPGMPYSGPGPHRVALQPGGSAAMWWPRFYSTCQYAKLPPGRYRAQVLAYSYPFDLRSPSARIMVSNIVEFDWPPEDKPAAAKPQ